MSPQYRFNITTVFTVTGNSIIDIRRLLDCSIVVIGISILFRAKHSNDHDMKVDRDIYIDMLEGMICFSIVAMTV